MNRAVDRRTFPLTYRPGAWSADPAERRSRRRAARTAGTTAASPPLKAPATTKTLVRRTPAEKFILEAVKDELADPEQVAYVLRRVEVEIAKRRSDLPDTLKLREADEVDGLRRSREKVFQAPPVEWIKDRLENLQEVLQNRTARSAKTLRDLLGPIRLELVTPDIGRPFSRAITALDALALIEPPSLRRAVRIPCKGGDGGN